MRRFVAVGLVLAFVVSLMVGNAWAGDRLCQRLQDQTCQQDCQCDCVCDCPNCDADCPHNCLHQQNRNRTRASDPDLDLIDWIFELGAGPWQGSPGPFHGGW